MTVPATSQPPRTADFVVIGGGILGLAVARELLARHPDASLCVLEREDRLAAHQTSHSSGVIHAGIYYAPGSLKARLCVEGSRLLYAYCDERGIEARRNGKLIIATEESELPRLDELERRGRANQVPGLRRVAGGRDRGDRAARPRHRRPSLPRDRRRRLRPGRDGLRSGCRGGRRSRRDGLRGPRPHPSSAEASPSSTRAASTDAGFVISCAGAWSDRLAVAAGAPAEPRIVPFRGAYLRLRPERRELVRASIYPVPDPELPFLGGHLTRGIDGEVLLGPSALMVGARDAYRVGRVRWRDLASNLAWPGTWRLVGRFWRTGLAELRHAASRRAFVAELRRFVPELDVGGRPPGPLGRPGPGGRPRRAPGRRLRRPPDRARPARAQRALARRDLFPRAGEADRRSGRGARVSRAQQPPTSRKIRMITTITAPSAISLRRR